MKVKVEVIFDVDLPCLAEKWGCPPSEARAALKRWVGSQLANEDDESSRLVEVR